MKRALYSISLINMVLSKLAQGYLQQIHVERLALKKRVYMGNRLSWKGRAQLHGVLPLVLSLHKDAAQIIDSHGAAEKSLARQGKDAQLSKAGEGLIDLGMHELLGVAVQKHADGKAARVSKVLQGVPKSEGML